MLQDQPRAKPVGKLWAPSSLVPLPPRCIDCPNGVTRCR
jgi:hypothetical protein